MRLWGGLELQLLSQAEARLSACFLQLEEALCNSAIECNSTPQLIGHSMVTGATNTRRLQNELMEPW